jgi:Uma2 family endonuclease
MEIADTSLEWDSILKKRLYAAAGIPCYWLLNLKTRSLEVYSVPQGNEYTRRGVHGPEQTVEVVLDGKLWERCGLAICSLTKPAALFH